MTNVITLPKTVAEYKAALSVKNQDTLAASDIKEIIDIETNPVKIYNAIVTGWNEVYINGVLIHEDVENEDMVDYRLREVEEVKERILDIISEHKTGSRNRFYMEKSLQFLFTTQDDYVFESTENCDLVTPSSDPELFNQICEEMLEASMKITKKEHLEEKAQKINVFEDSDCWRCHDCGCEWSIMMSEDLVPDVCPYCADED